MSKLEDYYRLFDMFSGKLTEAQKDVLGGLEDQIIAEEILPAISQSVAPVLSTLRRNLTLVVDYDTQRGITVKTTRGEVVVKEDTAKRYEIPSTHKVVKVAEMEDSGKETLGNVPEPDDTLRPKYSRGARVKFGVTLNGKEVPGHDGAGILAEAIRRIGFERVAALNIRYVNGRYNLVDRNKRLDQGKLWQREIDGWYIYTNTANPTKAADLADIATRLHLDMQIVLEGEQYYPKGEAKS